MSVALPPVKLSTVCILYAIAERVHGMAARTWIPTHDIRWGVVLALGPQSLAPRHVETDVERVVKGIVADRRERFQNTRKTTGARYAGAPA